MSNDKDEVVTTLKQMICDRTELGLTIGQIGDEQPLFDGPPGAVGLDSIEALELVVGIEEVYGLTIKADEVNVVEKFHSVSSLSDFVIDMKAAS